MRIEYTVYENDNRYVLEMSEERAAIGFSDGRVICEWKEGVSVTEMDELTRMDLSISYQKFTDNILTLVCGEGFCEFFWNIPVRELKVSDNDAEVRDIMRMEVKEIYDI